MFYFFNVQNLMTQESQEHIVEIVSNGYIVTFPYSDDNPNKKRVDEWIAEGNELTEWNPEGVEN
jgi:intracellular sulfur oxidation DsrE/DsrF family protein